MTLGGLMKHLALVESQWFDDFFRDLALPRRSTPPTGTPTPTGSSTPAGTTARRS